MLRCGDWFWISSESRLNLAAMCLALSLASMSDLVLAFSCLSVFVRDRPCTSLSDRDGSTVLNCTWQPETPSKGCYRGLGFHKYRLEASRQS